MFVSVFHGMLFQFEQREPAFAPLFQLPPNIAAFLPMLPPTRPPDDPGTQHAAHLGQQGLRRCHLVLRHATHPSALQEP